MAAMGSLGEESKSETVVVMVRIRRPIPREGDQAVVCFARGEDRVAVEGAGHNASCAFDRVFAPTASQEQVYAQVRDCAAHVVEGFNSTLFAYGQTSSGKTYTLFGPESSDNLRAGAVPKTAGIVPRAVRDVFARVKESTTAKFTCYISVMQVYNEHVYDLVQDRDMKTPLAIHENDAEGVYVEGLTEYMVTNAADALAIVAKGEHNRAVRATDMNEYSSRSHTLIQMQIEKQDSGALGVVRSKLNLVDLAGSEKWKTGLEMTDGHVSELTNINLSLYTLSRCISALAATAGGRREHVPFRESKLTRLLRDSLGGNAKTRVIATLSPVASNADESVSTIKFADSAKHVMTHARVNLSMLPDRLKVRQLEAEVERLRMLLSEMGHKEAADDGSGGGGGADDARDRMLVAKVQMLEEENRRVVELNMRLQAALESGHSGARSAGVAAGEGLASPMRAANFGAMNSAAAAAASEAAAAAAAAAGAAGVDPALEAALLKLRSDNAAMRDAMTKVQRASAKFFDLDIEEDDLRAAVQEAWTSMEARVTSMDEVSLEEAFARSKQQATAAREAAAKAAKAAEAASKPAAVPMPAHMGSPGGVGGPPPVNTGSPAPGSARKAQGRPPPSPISSPSRVDTDAANAAAARSGAAAAPRTSVRTDVSGKPRPPTPPFADPVLSARPRAGAKPKPPSPPSLESPSQSPVPPPKSTTPRMRAPAMGYGFGAVRPLP